MKKVMIALALLVGLNAAQAQNRNEATKDGQTRNRERTERSGFNKDPEARAKAKVEQLDKKLALTASQKESIHKLVLDQSKNAQALYKDSDPKNEETRNKAKELRAQTDRKIEALLDANQKEKYAEMQKNRSEWSKRTNRRPDRDKREGRKQDGDKSVEHDHS